MLIVSLITCKTNVESDTHDLQQELEEGVLDMIFQTDNVAPCSTEENIIMMAADTGNYEVVIDYLKNGGDPMLECECDKKTHYDCTSTRLSSYMKVCDSIRYVKYYLGLDIEPFLRNDFLQFFIMKDKNELVKYSLSIGAQLPEVYNNCTDCLDFFTKAGELGYDFNVQDPETGNTILMNLSFCYGCEDVTGQLETMEYFVSEGVNIHLKNIEGKTALDLATNEKIKAYLMSLED